MTETVLLIDDDPEKLDSVVRYLSGLGYETSTAVTGEEGIDLFHRFRPDVVVLDLSLPDLSGIDVLARIRELNGTVVVVAGTGNVQTAVRAIQLGAESCLASPVELPHLGAVVERAAETTRLRQQNVALRTRTSHEDPGQVEALGTSPMMAEIGRQLRRLAENASATVLLTGESGTGKGWVSRLIHRMSPRADRPFVEVNCAGLSATSLDSELFGHERGAFTGAKENRQGLFEAGHRGSLFLDEIAELAPRLQPKLLEVLQTRTFRRLGGSKEITVDVRLVAATNRALPREVERGRFLEDLFDRLNVASLHLPSVRDRPLEDRVALVHRLNAEIRHGMGLGPGGVAQGALECLVKYPWPGNIREMRNVIERANIFGEGRDQMRVEHLPAELRKTSRAGSIPFRPESLKEVEKRHIERVLRHHRGNRSRAAKDLGIARATLINKIRQYGLQE